MSKLRKKWNLWGLKLGISEKIEIFKCLWHVFKTAAACVYMEKFWIFLVIFLLKFEKKGVFTDWRSTHSIKTKFYYISCEWLVEKSPFLGTFSKILTRFMAIVQLKFDLFSIFQMCPFSCIQITFFIESCVRLTCFGGCFEVV